MAKKVVTIDEDQIKDWIEKGVKKLENIDCNKKVKCKSSGGCVWFLGFIGAAIYFWQSGQGVLGLLKALVWPAYLVFHLFENLKI